MSQFRGCFSTLGDINLLRLALLMESTFESEKDADGNRLRAQYNWLLTSMFKDALGKLAARHEQRRLEAEKKYVQAVLRERRAAKDRAAGKTPVVPEKKDSKESKERKESKGSKKPEKKASKSKSKGEQEKENKLPDDSLARVSLLLDRYNASCAMDLFTTIASRSAIGDRDTWLLYGKKVLGTDMTQEQEREHEADRKQREYEHYTEVSAAFGLPVVFCTISVLSDSLSDACLIGWCR